MGRLGLVFSETLTLNTCTLFLSNVLNCTLCPWMWLERCKVSHSFCCKLHMLRNNRQEMATSVRFEVMMAVNISPVEM
jgi:hypothetical protein